MVQYFFSFYTQFLCDTPLSNHFLVIKTVITGCHIVEFSTAEVENTSEVVPGCSPFTPASTSWKPVFL